MYKDDGDAIALSGRRLEMARDDLESAKILYDAGKYKAANNRAYYAIFHCLRAVLALDRFDSSKHSGIISEFRRRYLKDHILPVEISKIIDSAFEIRQDSDYDDGYEADIEETSEQISNAGYVLNTIEEYLKKQGVV